MSRKIGRILVYGRKLNNVAVSVQHVLLMKHIKRQTMNYRSHIMKKNKFYCAIAKAQITLVGPRSLLSSSKNMGHTAKNIDV